MQESSLINYTFSENYSELNSKPYLEVYESQNINHQDYFHHPEFQYACFDVFSKYTKCYLLSVFKNDKLIGYASFRMSKLSVRKINYQFLVPVAFSVAEYNYPIIHKNYIDDFFLVLNKALGNFNVHFQHVPGFFKKRILDMVNDSFVTRVVDCPLLINLDEHILKTSKRKSTIRNKKQLIKKYNDFEVKHLTSNINQNLLDSFFALHRNRWKEDGVDSNFNLEEYREVYYKISKLKIENIGFPILSYLRADGKYLSMEYGFVTNKRLLQQISARTLNKNYRSVGFILIEEVLEYMYSNQIDMYDMGVGLESYKYHYMNDVLTYFNILKFKSSFSSFISRVNLK